MIRFPSLTPPAQHEVVVQVHLAKAEIFRAVLGNSLRQPLYWIMPVEAGSILYKLQSPNPYAWIAALLVTIYLYFLIPYGIVRTTIKTPGVLAPIIYSFSDDGVTAQFENATVRTAWSLTKGIKETNDFLFVFLQRGSFHLIPRRCVTEEQILRLREILTKRASGKIQLSN